MWRSRRIDPSNAGSNAANTARAALRRAAAVLQSVRLRLHDMGNSGWVVLLAFVPIVNLALGLFLLFAPSRQGEARSGGLTVEETAQVLKVNRKTVMRDWDFAKTWLLLEMNRNEREAEAGNRKGLCLPTRPGRPPSLQRDCGARAPAGEDDAPDGSKAALPATGPR